MVEAWSDIPGTDYCVSDLGRVASRKGGKWRILKPGRDQSGYLQVKISAPDGGFTRRVHLLVAEAFLGPRPTPTHRVNHKNGIKGDARAENLEWMTQKENVQHGLTVLGNRRARGEQIGIHKMTPDQVRRMRARLAEGTRQVDLAREFGVSQGTVSGIKVGRSWRWVE